LLAVSGNSHGVAFLALDQSTKRGSVADIWTLTVQARPLALSDTESSSEYVRHMSIDCAKRTFSLISEDAYDAADRWVLWMPSRPSSAIEPSSVQDFMARVVCDGVSPPRRIIVHSPKEAREMTKKALALSRRR
jgi:hypothetical protein